MFRLRLYNRSLSPSGAIGGPISSVAVPNKDTFIMAADHKLYKVLDTVWLLDLLEDDGTIPITVWLTPVQI